MEMKEPSNEEIFGLPIYRCTRAQALADGALVDVSSTAQEAGFRLPVAMTAAAWADVVAWSDMDTRSQTPQDESGRLWDVLWMAHMAALQASGSSIVTYWLHRVPRDGRSAQPYLAALKMVICGGDDGAAVITIMLPHED